MAAPAVTIHPGRKTNLSNSGTLAELIQELVLCKLEGECCECLQSSEVESVLESGEWPRVELECTVDSAIGGGVRRRAAAGGRQHGGWGGAGTLGARAAGGPLQQQGAAGGAAGGRGVEEGGAGGRQVVRRL